MEKSITIRYGFEKSCGEMTLVLDRAFPMSQKEWRIIGPLVRDCADDHTIEVLQEHFRGAIEACSNEIREIQEEYVNTIPHSKRFKRCEQDLTKYQRLKEKTERNIKYLNRYLEKRRDV